LKTVRSNKEACDTLADDLELIHEIWRTKCNDNRYQNGELCWVNKLM